MLEWCNQKSGSFGDVPVRMSPATHSWTRLWTAGLGRPVPPSSQLRNPVVERGFQGELSYTVWPITWVIWVTVGREAAYVAICRMTPGRVSKAPVDVLKITDVQLATGPVVTR